MHPSYSVTVDSSYLGNTVIGELAFNVLNTYLVDGGLTRSVVKSIKQYADKYSTSVGSFEKR